MNGDNVKLPEEFTLRDYFAAHAPVEPWPQYKPTLPDRPHPGIPIGESGTRYVSRAAADKAEFDCWSWSNQQAVTEWDEKKEREYRIQWPYFYADAMLKERTK